MHTPVPPSPQHSLARQVRQRWVNGLCAGLAALDSAILEYLSPRPLQAGNQRELPARGETWLHYQECRTTWIRDLDRAFREALVLPVGAIARRTAPGQAANLELLSDEAVENKILASRLGAALLERVSGGFDALRLRLPALEGKDLPDIDVLRPDTVSLLLVHEWAKAGLSRSEFQMVMEPVQSALVPLLQKMYQESNDFLLKQGVLARRDLRVRVNPAPAVGAGNATADMASRALGNRAADSRTAGGAATPLAQVRQRAQGIMGQLRRLLSTSAAGSGRAFAPSGALAQALTGHRADADTYYGSTGALVQGNGPDAVVHLAGAMRQRSAELKKIAGTDSEKAIIEVVALMFLSILAEDRIPSSVRVWFARLQLPVLRVALAEPEFFSDPNHPARQLIDRMGACVMGFDTTTINGSALETEISRIVQVIEQYPETGHRVFQLVHEEFEKFLAKFLTQKQATSRLVSVAQQVEQRETLAIQYTIELRALLKDMPVREGIRSFLFKTWAEVLALSAVRDGAQHPDTVAFKRTAADLVWAASAKASRSERAQVIKLLPELLQRLRQGLALIGVAGASQDARIKALTDTLAEAFLSDAGAIAQAHFDALTQRLVALEDFIGDAVPGDLPLDAEHIEMMTGIDASSIHVVADNGAPVDDAMVAWAQELQPGAWFMLDHNGVSVQVQYAWHSQRKQLHLFVAADGRSILIQLRRLAAYLQAGLLVAREDEGLTVRATRDALAKIDANPERLLG